MQITGKGNIIIVCLRTWPNTDINIRIYSWIGNMWHNIAVIYLTWHMTILGLYTGSDSVMEAVQTYLHPRLAACSPDRLLRSSDLHRLHLCHDNISPEGRDGGILFQPVVLDSFFRLRAFTGGHKWIDMCTMTGFPIICNSLYQPPAFLLHAINIRFPHASMWSMHVA